MPASKEAATANLFEIYSNSNGKSVDVRTGAPRIEYRESMIDHTIRISAAIVDTGNASSADNSVGKTISASEALKLQGCEKVLFKYTDAAGNVLDFSKDNSLRLSHKNFETKTFKGSSFIAQIVSKEFFDNKLLENRVTRRYSGKISESVKTILQQDLKTDKTVYCSETLNKFSDFGLRKTPFDVILELQQISIPNVSKARKNTAGYFFWQTSKGFHFKSADEIFNATPVKKYIYNFKVDREIPAGYDDKILDLSAKRIIDAERQLDYGAFGSVTETFNYATQQYKKDEPLIAENIDKVLAGKDLPNYGEYSKKPTNFFASPEAIGMAYGTGDSIDKQLEKSKEENFSVSETISQAIQNYRQRLNFMTEITIPGDFSLHAGDIIQCDLPELATEKTPVRSPKDSGIYMILELCHYISPTQTYTGLVLVRDSFGVKV
jgi:hypothetical protein